jgi:glycerophosphoryl diester phosphodiesterase
MKPLISAHQGGRVMEGVSAAERYRQAIALGVDYVEFDVRRTHDGATVIFHAAGRVGLHLDLKEPGYEAEIVETMLDRCAVDEFVITSGVNEIRTIKDAFPQVRGGLSIGDDLKSLAPWLKVRHRLSELFPRRRIEQSRADFIAVHQDLATLTALRYCARKHLPAWVWTVDDERGIARFIADPRVHALITNRPDIAIRLRGLSSA